VKERGKVDILEWLPESETDSSVLMFESSIDSGDFLEHVHVILSEHADPAEVCESFIALTSSHEPTWGFFDEK
jgi:hypoxanthine-guanine phosphoribosyltransferase